MSTNGDTEQQIKIDSIVGPLYLVASDKGLRGVFWKRQKEAMTKNLNAKDKPNTYLRQAIRELEEYFAGERTSFDVPLDIHLGTNFQRRVWRELQKIPYGKTVSYKDVAIKLKSNAIRAVGTANGRNPLSIIVPCHRVIASNGGLGGYAKTLEVKQRLLDLERSES